MNKVSKNIIDLNPLTKLLAVFILGTVTIIYPGPWLGFAILTCLLFVSIITKLFLGFFKLIFGFGIPLTLMLIFIQGFYYPKNETILWDAGFAQLGLEGIFYALKLISTLLVFMGAFFLMNQTAETAKLVAALVKSGLNPKVGYLVLASLNVVPQMNRRMKIIKEAQESRGVDIDGNLFQRFKSFLPLIGPVVLCSFTDAQERGMTLETRGFAIKGIQPTSYTQVETTIIDRVVRMVLIVSLVATVLFVLFLK